MSETFVARFWSRTEPAGDCLLWTGGVARKGYPYGRVTITRDGKRDRVMAHRLAYELTHGALTDGQVISHTCDNPPCVNPEHLFAGSNEDNMRDMHAKGRSRWRHLQEASA